MKAGGIAAAVAGVGLMFAPLAAQAGTQASSSVVKVQVGSAMGTRASGYVDKRNKAKPAVAGIALLLMAAGICAALCGGGKSRGT